MLCAVLWAYSAKLGADSLQCACCVPCRAHGVLCISAYEMLCRAAKSCAFALGPGVDLVWVWSGRWRLAYSAGPVLRCVSVRHPPAPCPDHPVLCRAVLRCRGAMKLAGGPGVPGAGQAEEREGRWAMRAALPSCCSEGNRAVALAAFCAQWRSKQHKCTAHPGMLCTSWHGMALLNPPFAPSHTHVPAPLPHSLRP